MSGRYIAGWVLIIAVITFLTVAEVLQGSMRLAVITVAFLGFVCVLFLDLLSEVRGATDRDAFLYVETLLVTLFALRIVLTEYPGVIGVKMMLLLLLIYIIVMWIIDVLILKENEGAE